LPAQTSGVLTVKDPAKLSIKRNSAGTAVLSLSLKPGYHLNSNEPSEAYLIPLRLTWENTLLKTQKVEFPKPAMQKFDFSEKPLSVYAGDFQISTVFEAAPNTSPGPNIVIGKLRYQACSDTMCLPPKTVEVRLPVVVQ
jgi:hypothetical protein